MQGLFVTVLVDARMNQPGARNEVFEMLAAQVIRRGLAFGE